MGDVMEILWMWILPVLLLLLPDKTTCLEEFPLPMQWQPMMPRTCYNGKVCLNRLLVNCALMLLTLLVSLAEKQELGQLSDLLDTEVMDMSTDLCRLMTDTTRLKEGHTLLTTSDKELRS